MLSTLVPGTSVTFAAASLMGESVRTQFWGLGGLIGWIIESNELPALRISRHSHASQAHEPGLFAVQV
jgi:hypothetical protein